MNINNRHHTTMKQIKPQTIRLYTLVCIIIIFFQLTTNAQPTTLTQTIRGQVIDNESKISLPGASVILVSDSTHKNSATTDIDGYFKLTQIPIGRQAIKVSYIGYKDRIVSNIIVNSAKEVVLNIELEESALAMEAVEITATKKGEVLNEMSTVSARIFSAEEAQRYAGSRADPARMASNYAGVQGADDSRNDIVVRGNSPLGLLWRLENVNIPNPNHFAISGSTGGPVSILNNKVLGSSDFMTGAFPAEYGNSTAGIFDLRMRNGNNEKHEFTGQFGFLGTELLAEGPISRKSHSSYMLTYRYSTLSIFHALGIDIGTNAVPKYQDASFKLNFPMKNNSNLSFFGIGGTSSVDILVSTQEIPGREIYGETDKDQYFATKMGVVGTNYTKSFNANTFGRLTLSTSYNDQITHHDYVYRHIIANPDSVFVLDSVVPYMDYAFRETKVSASWYVNHKINILHSFKFGCMTDVYLFNYIDTIRNLTTYDFEYRFNYAGNALLLQPYVQWKYKIRENVVLNAGIHSQYFTLNNSISWIEPRLGIKWDISPKQSLGAAIGMHSQTQPTYIYFYHHPDSSPDAEVYNKNIGFTRSNHYVLSYDRTLSMNSRLKVETYYQQLYDVPVETSYSAYSAINQGDEYSRIFPDTLQNTGSGENYGVELTLEKFFSKTYFFMFTVSLYESTYKGSDGIKRSTDFNGNYTFNAIGGKEFVFGKNKNQNIGIGLKLTTAGGKRYSPIDTASSALKGEAVYIDSETNSLQFKRYFRTDIKLNYKINTKRLTHEIGLDLVNIFDTKNLLSYTYVPGVSDPIRQEYQLGFLPIFYYAVDF